MRYINLKRNNSYKTIPWFVCYISITVIAQFFLINFKEHFSSIHPETLTLFGAPDTVSIYKGQFWGVFTNNFIHIYWDQLVINLVGLWLFGAFIERRKGALVLFGLVIFSAVITSLCQLALTTEPGIGLSGVNYALFGYILIKSKKEKEFKLRGRYLLLIFMIAILIYCNYFNFANETIFRTEAMSSGLFLGLLLGYLNKTNSVFNLILIFVIFIFSISTLFYAPWSSEWQLYKGVKSHEAKNYIKAKVYYRKALKIDPKNQQAIDNLKLLKMDELKVKAYGFHIKKKYDIARKYYLKILEIDPKDEWTNDNIKELP